MWQAIAGSAVSTAGGIIGQAMANKANRKLQQQQLNWNEEMWNQNNQYNTPQAQMQRFRDAGLNPNLVLGQGSMTSGNSGSPAEGTTPAQMSNVMEGFDPISNYFAIKNQMQGIENMKTTREEAYSRIGLNELEGLLKGASYKEKQWIIKEHARNFDYDTKQREMDLTAKAIQLQAAQLGLKGQSLENQNKIIENNRATIQLMYEDIQQQLITAKSYWEIKNSQIGSMISYKEYKYMKDHQFKMGTSSAIVGILEQWLTGGEGNESLRKQLQNVGQARRQIEQKETGQWTPGQQPFEEWINSQFNDNK